jgi:CDGSH-type Zn-finger protein
VTVTLQATLNGPLVVNGEHSIHRADGGLVRQSGASRLCRCGHSQDAPFCDGTHAALPFRDDATRGVHRAKPSDADSADARLRIVLRVNGPLRCVGMMEVSDASGQVLFAGAQTALCRCGSSRNKPFCDGSHIESGFSAA